LNEKHKDELYELLEEEMKKLAYAFMKIKHDKNRCESAANVFGVYGLFREDFTADE